MARDFQLPGDWMNTEVALQWQGGLPPTLQPPLLQSEIIWRSYGALRIGLAGRRTLIMLKSFAAVINTVGGCGVGS